MSNTRKKIDIPPAPRAIQPLRINQMAHHHLMRMQNISLNQGFVNPTITVHGSLDGIYGVVDLGVIQVVGGVRWDQIFGRKK